MESSQETLEKKGGIGIPGAILLAGLIIAGAIVYTQNSDSKITGEGGIASEKVSFRTITSEDYLRGNPKAPVIILEYSDTECPFCKRFHETMNTVMETYGKEGKVAWVYRHLPLEQLHAKAKSEALAAECAGKIGGNEKFWEYLDLIFETTTSNDGLDLALLPQFAENIGIEKEKFTQCLEKKETEKNVLEDMEDAVRAGAQGTPYPIIIDTRTNKTEVLPGAVPYAELKTVYLDALLGNN